MPELPEVETTRRVLEDELKGQVVAEVVVPKVTFYRPPPASVRKLKARRLNAFSRRGKYLLIEAEGLEPVSLHLGMSGRLYLSADDAGLTHVRFALRFKDRTLFFCDPRRFGRVGCELPDFGPEPLSPDWDAAVLSRALKASRAPVKAALMDQGVVAGLGNIYATEALFRAGVRPGRRANTLKAEETAKLAQAARAVLEEGVRLGGCTLDDEAYLDPRGRPGRFQNAVAVYGRKVGACGHALRATKKPIAGRTSMFCPECQK